MPFRNLFQQLGFWTTVLSWKEPSQYRARLRGDMLLRLALAAAVGCVPMAILLVLFAINVNPPHPAFALAGFLVGAVMAGLILLNGENSAGGAVRVCQEGITRKRMFTPRIPVHFGVEEASWPYGSFTRAIIVPGQAIGQSFSVLLLTDERDIDLIGIPSKIPLEQLAQALSARGVRVESGSFVPESFTRPLAWPIAAVAGLVGMVFAVGGLGFYAINTLDGGGGRQIARGPAPEVLQDNPFPADFARPANKPPPPPPVQQQPAQTAPPPPPATPAENAAAETTPAETALAPAPGGFPRPPIGRSLPGNPANPFDPFATPAAAAAPQSPDSGELIGGKGGFPFRADSPGGQPVLGFRYAAGAWAGKKALAQLDPLFDRNPAAGGPAQVLAKEGYAVGGLELDASDMVYAVRIIFMRQQEGGKLDSTDTYTSNWLGAPAGNPPQKLTSTQTPITGIHGRKGAVIDALGLVLAQP